MRLVKGSWVGSLILLVAVPMLSSQSKSNPSSNSKGSVQSLASLSKPMSWSAVTIRMFDDDLEKMTFTLVTSWIPGDDRKGMLRYTMNARPEYHSSAIEVYEQLIKRVARCVVQLKLLDEDGFILRSHEVPFAIALDDQYRVHGLRANDFMQMDANEYRPLFEGKGSWDISWRCPR